MYWSAFLFGLLGSLHCAGMCGPLVLALPSPKNNLLFFISKLLYHFFRIFSYTLIGFVFAYTGSKLNFGSFQQGLSILSGILILIWGLSQMPFFRNKTNLNISKLYLKFTQPVFSLLSGNRGILGQSVTGFLNGFLPCGLVYLAAFVAVGLGNAGKGITYMLFFGFGTLPMMLSFSFGQKFLSPKIRFGFNRVLPFIALLIGLMFILRGSNLNIPYLSPEIPVETTTSPENCN